MGPLKEIPGDRRAMYKGPHKGQLSYGLKLGVQFGCLSSKSLTI